MAERKRDKWFQLGLEYYEKEDFEVALKWFRKAAKARCVEAQYRLGTCYALGRGVKKNATEAAK